MHQFWASAIVLRLKKYETRDWQIDPATSQLAQMPVAGLAGIVGGGMAIAIHAGLTDTAEYRDLFRRDPFRSQFAACGVTDFDQLPRGYVLGIVSLVKIHPVVNVLPTISPVERAFGDFSAGRFAWEFSEDVFRFNEPVPARGSRKVWNWEAPLELCGIVEEWCLEHRTGRERR